MCAQNQLQVRGVPPHLRSSGSVRRAARHSRAVRALCSWLQIWSRKWSAEIWPRLVQSDVVAKWHTRPPQRRRYSRLYKHLSHCNHRNALTSKIPAVSSLPPKHTARTARGSELDPSRDSLGRPHPRNPPLTQPFLWSHQPSSSRLRCTNSCLGRVLLYLNLEWSTGVSRERRRRRDSIVTLTRQSVKKKALNFEISSN